MHDKLGTVPRHDLLIQASTLLSARPDLKTKSYAAEIAWAEYVHFVAQTYYFEKLGIDIVLDCFDGFHGTS